MNVPLLVELVENLKNKYSPEELEHIIYLIFKDLPKEKQSDSISDLAEILNIKYLG